MSSFTFILCLLIIITKHNVKYNEKHPETFRTLKGFVLFFLVKFYLIFSLFLLALHYLLATKNKQTLFYRQEFYSPDRFFFLILNVFNNNDIQIKFVAHLLVEHFFSCNLKVFYRWRKVLP